MLPKISFVYDRKHNRKVEACVYYAGKRRYLATGVTLPDNATYRNGVISGCATAPSLNKTLATAMNNLQAQLQKQIDKDVFDVSGFSLSLKHNVDSFYEWAQQKCNEQNVRKSTKDEDIKGLTRWKEKGVEMFADITQGKIERAVNEFAKTLRPTTTRRYMIILGKYINMAVKAKIVMENPMENVARPKGKTKDICYLTHEELEMVEKAVAPRCRTMARDMFLFSCYTGLAYSDLTKITKEDIMYIDKKPYIIDRRQKTGSTYRLRLLPKAMAILEKYDYNLALMENSLANAHLRYLEKQIKGFKKHLSMHVGRHTFATLALSAGVRIETVSRMLAHSDIKTTQIYAKVLQKDVDEGFDILEKI